MPGVPDQITKVTLILQTSLCLYKEKKWVNRATLVYSCTNESTGPLCNGFNVFPRFPRMRCLLCVSLLQENCTIPTWTTTSSIYRQSSPTRSHQHAQILRETFTHLRTCLHCIYATPYCNHHSTSRNERSADQERFVQLIFTQSHLAYEQLLFAGDIFAGRAQSLSENMFQVLENGGVIFSENEQWKEQRRFALQTLRDFGMGRNFMEEKILNSVTTMVTQVCSLMFSYCHFDSAAL